MGDIKQFDTLSTSFVNLAALLRQLRSQNFAGSVRVVLEHYEAEVIFNGRDTETVSEIDRVTRQAVQTEGAMERLLVHAREPGGTITIIESNSEVLNKTAEAHAGDNEEAANAPFAVTLEAESLHPVVDWDNLLDAGGALVNAVEHVVHSLGLEFAKEFRAARIELGDDYPFLDPTGNGITYADSRITLRAQPSSNTFVTGLSECLRRIVNKLAMGKEQKRFRETVAVELAVAARMRADGLAAFKSQLDQIAGTRVL